MVTLEGGRLGDAYAFDAGWVESVEKKASLMKERLEGDLQASRTSMAKESIRLVSGCEENTVLHICRRTACSISLFFLCSLICLPI